MQNRKRDTDVYNRHSDKWEKARVGCSERIAWNKYTIKGEIDHQPRLDAWDKCSGLVHWDDPEGWDGEHM